MRCRAILVKLALSCVTCVLVAATADADPPPATEPAPLTFFPRPADGREPRRIVYVSDVSGASMEGAPLGRHQIERAVRELLGAQSFDVVLVGADEPRLFAKTLVPASDKMRDDACNWLEHAGTSPRPSALIPAIRAALALNPDVVYLVENRNFVDPATVHEIGLLNRGRALRIDTITLLRDPADAGWMEAFHNISIQNGGAWSPIKLDEFDPARTTGLGGSMFVLAREQAQLNRIVFICDASGSMLNKFASLRLQLQRAVNALRPTQSFNLIFTREQDCTRLAPNLIRATPKNMQEAETFLEDKVTPRGETNPMPAIEAAFAQQPDLIFLLTDGDFPDNRAVLKRIRELNHAAKVPVNTIAFVGEADTDTDFFNLLQQIADATGGHHKLVKENELK